MARSAQLAANSRLHDLTARRLEQLFGHPSNGWIALLVIVVSWTRFEKVFFPHKRNYLAIRERAEDEKRDFRRHLPAPRVTG